MGGELGKATESALAQMVLEAFDVGKMVAVVKSHQLEKISQHGVTFADLFRHPAALRGQGKPAVRLVTEKAQLTEALDHDGGAGPVQAQGLGDVGDTRVALRAFEI